MIDRPSNIPRPSLLTMPWVALLGSQISLASCPASPSQRTWKESDTYRRMPFQAGEISVMSVKYLGIRVGQLRLEVLTPQRRQGRWHMAFRGSIRTDGWYSGIYTADDEALGVSRPHSFAAAHFRLKQFHRQLLGKNYRENKELEFRAQGCRVQETVKKNAAPAKTKSFFWHPESSDILSAIFRLRAQNYNRGVTRSFLVYTSEQNWQLRATSEEHVTLRTALGNFKAARLRLETAIGKEFQQKGDVRVWLAIEHTQRPILKIAADIKIGRFVAEIVALRTKQETRSGSKVLLHEVPR